MITQSYFLQTEKVRYVRDKKRVFYGLWANVGSMRLLLAATTRLATLGRRTGIYAGRGRRRSFTMVSERGSRTAVSGLSGMPVPSSRISGMKARTLGAPALVGACFNQISEEITVGKELVGFLTSSAWQQQCEPSRAAKCLLSIAICLRCHPSDSELEAPARKLLPRNAASACEAKRPSSNEAMKLSAF